MMNTPVLITFLKVSSFESFEYFFFFFVCLSPLNCLPYAIVFVIVLVFLDAIAITQNLGSSGFNISRLSLQF